jgi:hypothetical protein
VLQSGMPTDDSNQREKLEARRTQKGHSKYADSPDGNRSLFASCEAIAVKGR